MSKSLLGREEVLTTVGTAWTKGHSSRKKAALSALGFLGLEYMLQHFTNIASDTEIGL